MTRVGLIDGGGLIRDLHTRALPPDVRDYVAISYEEGL